MEHLMNWVRQIVFFLIFMSVFYQFVPDKKYKSYLKLFASLALILLTLNPLIELFDMRGQLDFNQNVFAYPREVEEFRLRAEQAQGQQYEDVLENYRRTVEEQLRAMAERFGLYVSDCEVELSGETESFGQVTKARLVVSYRRLDENPGEADQLRGANEVQEIEEVKEVRIPSIQTENGMSETDSGQRGESGRQTETDAVQMETESALPETAGNQDTLKLAEQIASLYQLGPEQVKVDLKE